MTQAALSNSDNLDNLRRIGEAIAAQFAPLCEVVIHDLARPESSIVFMSGNVTGRRIGGPATDFVLGLLATDEAPNDVLNYISRTKDGGTLKSSTVFLRDSEGTPIGVFCINYDITYLIAAVNRLSELTIPTSPVEVRKSFSTDLPDLLQGLIQESVESVLGKVESNGAPIGKDQRRRTIADLEARGIFRIRNSVPAVASALGVSRYTIYKDLKLLRRGQPDAHHPEARPVSS